MLGLRYNVFASTLSSVSVSIFRWSEMGNSVAVQNLSSVITVDDALKSLAYLDMKPSVAYATLMNLVELNCPVFESDEDSELLAEKLGWGWFRRIEWYNPNQYEQIAKLPVPFLRWVFSKLGGGESWWSVEGFKFLESGYLDAAKMKQVFVGIIRADDASYYDYRRTGQIVKSVKSAEVILVVSEAFKECYTGKEFDEEYKTMFLDFLIKNPYCPRAIFLENVEANRKSSYEHRTNLNSLFSSIDFTNQEEMDVLVPVLMGACHPYQRDLVCTLVEDLNVSDEVKADIFIRYYSPFVNKEHALTAVGYYTKGFSSVVKLVEERLYEEARVLFSDPELEGIPYVLMVESLAVGDSEGYRYLLEFEHDDD